MNLKELYDNDYHEWLKANISLLKESKFDEIDLNNIIVELEGFCCKHKRESREALINVFIELLSWDIQCSHRCETKKLGFNFEMRGLKETINESPSLKAYIEKKIDDLFEIAKNRYMIQTGFSISILPEKVKYKLDEILELKLEVREDFKVFGA